MSVSVGRNIFSRLPFSRIVAVIRQIKSSNDLSAVRIGSRNCGSGGTDKTDVPVTYRPRNENGRGGCATGTKSSEEDERSNAKENINLRYRWNFKMLFVLLKKISPLWVIHLSFAAGVQIKVSGYLPPVG